ncbi:unnamed protein product, partial [Rotaria magnacalcarata]
VDDGNFDEFLKEVGFGMIKCWVVKEIHPRLVISEHEGTCAVRAKTTLKTKIISFTPGIELDDSSFDGQNAKTSLLRYQAIFVLPFLSI